MKEARASASSSSLSPVVVELFTSEGCSDCPPADRVLADLETSGPSGITIVPLAFHVDYWDGIGWKDPFSSSLWTDRQQTYARAQARSNVYTPQMIVDGREEFVGSDASHAENAISAASKRAKATVSLTIQDLGGGKEGARSLSIRVGELSSSAATSDVVMFVTEARATVDVKRGENSGRRLEHTAIVRALRVVGSTTETGGTFSTPIDPNWGSERAVVIVQERSTRAIDGAATLRL